MKILTVKFVRLFLMVLCLMLLPALSPQAAPGEICVHGNSGQVQDAGTNASHSGWGIDYDVAGTGSWLQYSIPITNGTKINGIRILFSKDRPSFKNGWIRHVHVYDGPYVIKKFDNLFLGKDDANKTINKVLSMAPTQINHGLGISILTETKVAGNLKQIVNFEFHCVCALTTP